MKNYAILLICVALLFSGCGISVLKPKPVQTQPPTVSADPLEKLHTDIDAVLQEALFTTASIGIKIVAVETGEVIYEKNPFKLHHPASTTKLFTAATALAKLGSDYRFETTVYVDAEVDTQVAGNIYLKGRADPVLQPQDIVKLADVLLESGVKSIQGDILVDTTYLDTVREGPGWMWDDRPLRISALSIRQIEPEPGTRSRALACGYLLKNELIEKGIEVTGDVVPGTVPLDARTAAKHLSPPLADIIKLMNKPSDNWIAELLFKTIGAEVMGEPGTWQKGRDAVNEFLEEIIGEPPAHRFVDGSGLSRYNLLNAELLTKLLVYMYQNFELMPEYVASLPIAGVDGTLSHRMQGVSAEKVLRAKTGTLSGVSALAGYAVTADDEVFAFGILISHYVGSAIPARDIQDQIGNYLTEFSRRVEVTE
ncbi:D-alanyl-D-alanine carboxypeptidase/D-alanyl-D-alanine-endopeptidase [Candidatus Poribacteria bacterium]|nr:MAG: D-alanyl-D-alanine carboxypeptidase/D-alanyl-D-alanine-endopeptidase [Candidatus Poribacteria bacterium]